MLLEHFFEEDKFTNSVFSDEEGNSYSVERCYELAKKMGIKVTNIPISKLERELIWWEQDKEGQSHQHMLTVDTKYPILVTNDNGHLSVADGLNRLKKVKDIEHRDSIPAYILPWTEQVKQRVMKR